MRGGLTRGTLNVSCFRVTYTEHAASLHSELSCLVEGRGARGYIGEGNSQLRATSGPNHEPRSPNVELIGCLSVGEWSSFLSLRTVVRA
jgi:hypothetical protein